MAKMRGGCLAVAGIMLAALDTWAEVRAGDSPPSSAGPERFSIEAGLEHLRWREFDEGSRLLAEHGPRLVLSASLHNLLRPDSGLLYTARLKGYGGSADYDGQDSAGNYVATASDYRGWKAEIGGGYRSARFSGDAGAVDLLAGIGMEQWRREIRNSRNALGEPVHGLAEDYSIVYARAGLGLAYRHGAHRGYIQAGMKYPVSTHEHVMLNGQEVNLSPGRRGSGYASWRVSLLSTRDGEPFGAYVDVYYDSFRFSRSETVAVAGFSVWQPESRMDVVGVRIGVAYR